MLQTRTALLATMIALAVTALARGQEVSTRGTDFWFGFMENRDVNGSSFFSLSISSDVNTSGTIEVPLTGLSIPFTVTANRATMIELPMATFNASGSERIEAKGINVRSNDPVSVAVLHYRLFFSDASIVLPTSRLGSSYRALAAVDDGLLFSPSELLIVAAEEDTEIEIVPSALTANLRPAGRPFTVSLRQGEVYQIKAMGDLTGTSVRSTNGKRFALFGGAEAAAIECSDDSHVYDQIHPVEGWGQHYAVIPFQGKLGDRVKVVAANDSTIVRFDCAREVILNAGAFLDTLIQTPTIITGSKPIAVAQMGRGQQCGGFGGPTFLVLEPLSNGVVHRSFASLTPFGMNIFEKHYLCLVAAIDQNNHVMLDGRSLDATFIPFGGSGRYGYSIIEIDSGSHLLSSSRGVAAYAYGLRPHDGYTYSLGADRPMATPGDSIAIDFKVSATRSSVAITGCDTMMGTAAICAWSDVTFAVDSTNPMQAHEWHWSFGDGASAVGRRVHHSYSSAGQYTVTVTRFGSDCLPHIARRVLAIGNCNVANESAIKLSPNPSADWTTVEYLLQETSSVDIAIYDMTGKLVEQIVRATEPSGLHRVQVDLQRLTVGSYMVQGVFNGHSVSVVLTIAD